MIKSLIKLDGNVILKQDSFIASKQILNELYLKSKDEIKTAEINAVLTRLKINKIHSQKTI